MTERILIYRSGSIGDTVVALPSFRLIANAFPNAQRRLLTLSPGQREVSVAAVLEQTGLIHDALHYPKGLRQAAGLLALARSIRAWSPHLLIHLAPRLTPWPLWRDVAFFRLCGIPRIIGAQTAVPRRENGLYEQESLRLARCLAALGDADPHNPANRHLDLTAGERAAARALLAHWPTPQGFVALAPGAKIPSKDWGEDNWRHLLCRLGQHHPALGLLLVGSPQDQPRAQRLAPSWPGPTRILCQQPARITAALLEHSRLFLGTDGGPAHLAAAQGVPGVLLFSGHGPPGQWFPMGDRLTILHQHVPCAGCLLDRCPQPEQYCTRTLSPARMLAACLAQLAMP